MQTLPVLYRPPTASIPEAFVVNKASFVSLFLASQNSASTHRSYGYGLRCFATFMQTTSIDEAMRNLFTLDAGGANALIESYKVSMKGKLAPSSINLRLSSVREAVKTARRFGMIDWSLQVENVQAEAYRDTKGCGYKGYLSLLSQITGDEPTDRRNRAILHLLFDLALRRASVASIDVEDLDFRQSRLKCQIKRKAEKVWRTVPEETQGHIQSWLSVHPVKSGPLFVNLDRTKRYNRLHAATIRKIVDALGQKAGIKVTPHKLRHAAGTTALEAGMDVRSVQKFMGHSNINTTMIYDDRRKDMAGEVASVLSRLPKEDSTVRSDSENPDKNPDIVSGNVG